MGSPRKGSTFKVVTQFEQELNRLGAVNFDYIFLKDLQLNSCRGCELCLSKGEKFCPLDDDRDIIYDRMMSADGVIFATPIYSLQVTSLLKNLLDRMAYIFHRPCFFGKTSMAIVSQGVIGGDKVVDYLNELAAYWGFNVSPGLALTIPWEKPLLSEERQKGAAIKKAAANFHGQLHDSRLPIPTLKQAVFFRAVQAVHKVGGGLETDRDYYEAHGWLTSKYYYDVQLNPAKSLIGSIVGRLVTRQTLKTKKA